MYPNRGLPSPPLFAMDLADVGKESFPDGNPVPQRV
jgi:hypothetical protein